MPPLERVSAAASEIAGRCVLATFANAIAYDPAREDRAAAIRRCFGDYLKHSEAVAALEAIPLERAVRALADLMQQGLAYRSDAIAPLPENLDRARAFFEAFGAGVATLSNSSWLDDYGPDPSRFTFSGWNPLTSSTFDTGIVAVGAGIIGAIWFEDED